MTCFECEHSIFCQSWGQLECAKRGSIIYKVHSEDTCKYFSKRETGHILDKPCRCWQCKDIRGEED